MKVIVKKSVLKQVVKNRLLENRSYHSDRIDYIEGDTDDTPVEPSPMMATQLAAAMPPVEDPEFVPGTTSELGRSAAIISEEVPESQIDFFYRMLHRLLDKSLDRSQSAQKIQESQLIKMIDGILSEAEEKVETLKDESDLQEPEDEELEPEEGEESEFSPSIGKVEIEDIVDAMVSKNLNVGPLIDPETGRQAVTPTPVWNDVTQQFELGELGMTVLRSEADAVGVVIQAFRSDRELGEMLVQYLNQQDQKTSDKDAVVNAAAEIASSFESRLGKEELPIDTELAGEMYANILSDKLYSQAETDEDYDSLVSQEILSMRDSDGVFPVKISGARSQQKIDVPYESIISHLEKAKQERVAGLQQDVFQVDEVDWGDDPDPGLTQEEIDQIERDQQLRNLKKLDGLAPYFGFKNASGIRQWRRKFAEPKMKALVGDLQGFSAYEGYYEDVSDRLSGLLDSLEDAAADTLSDIESALKANPDDDELSDLQEIISQIVGDLRSLQSSRNESEDEELDADLMLNLDGGRMLRFAFDQLYFKKEFSNFAGQMKKHMVEFLSNQGVDSKAASVFAKMFNGETDLVPLNDSSSGAQKLRAGGITTAIYRAAISEHTNFAKTFFTGARNKITAKNLMKMLGDKAAMKRLISDSLHELSLEDQRHEEYLRASLPKDQESSQQGAQDKNV